MQQLMKVNTQLKSRQPSTGLWFHTVVQVPVEVDYDLTWEKAIQLGAPGTSSDNPVMKAGEQYQYSKRGKQTVTLSLCYTGPPAGDTVQFLAPKIRI